jgi:hypothetical protein
MGELENKTPSFLPSFFPFLSVELDRDEIMQKGEKINYKRTKALST